MNTTNVATMTTDRVNLAFENITPVPIMETSIRTKTSMTKASTLLYPALLASCCLFACSNKFTGDLRVDGKSFEFDSCRSGQVYGYAGVEIVSKNGAKLRILQAPTGEAVAYYIPSSKSTGVQLGTCGAFSFKAQHSTVNDIKNVEGSAKLSCESAGHAVKGSFVFSNCH